MKDAPARSSMDPVAAMFCVWRARPTADATIGLCEALVRQGDVLEVEVDALAQLVERMHGEDGHVLAALGALQLHVGDPRGAIRSFSRSLALLPERARTFRLLGEALLRTGDAIRAERVFLRTRLLELGVGRRQTPTPGFEDTEQWLQRAKGLASIQAIEGAGRVAELVARSLGPSSRSGTRPRVSIKPPSTDLPIDVDDSDFLGDTLEQTPTPAFDDADTLELVREKKRASGK